MFDEYLVRHTSPTLAGIKVGSLICVPMYEIDNIIYRKKTLLTYGINIVILKKYQSSLLLYIYRQNMLEEILSDKNTFSFLETYGYTDIYSSVDFLKKRMSENSFPHEVGIFLGYPLTDVEEFIVNKGRNYKFTGYWKVYSNYVESKKIFKKYVDCTEKFMNAFLQGIEVTSLCTI